MNGKSGEEMKIGLPSAADATTQRKFILNSLSLQNLIQLCVGVLVAAFTIGVYYHTTAAQNDRNQEQVQQAKVEIEKIKTQREEDRKVYESNRDQDRRAFQEMAGDIKLILYRLDEADKRAVKQQ